MIPVTQGVARKAAASTTYIDLSGQPAPVDLSKAFERVVVINLPRRADRMERFWARLEGNWPFARPQRFEAVDGATVPMPAEWDKGAGAWGCLLSHRAVLDAAISDGVSSLLVLEDDAYPVNDLAAQVRRFFSRLPGDWDGLMLGAQHLLPPMAVEPGVVRCQISNRSHGYAVRGKLMEMLSTFWQANQVDHCDIVLASLMKHYKFYAPDPLLLGQEAGQSDVTPRIEPLRFVSRKAG